MPPTQTIIYCDENGEAPLISWLQEQLKRVQDKCIAAIELLAEQGNELRRPHADILEREIWELRVRHGKTNYRILYTFVGKNAVLLSHGIIKKGREVPKKEIKKAVENRKKYLVNPSKHTYKQ